MKTEELLNQENGEALVLRQEMIKIQKKIDKLYESIVIKRKKLKEICKHSSTKIVESYIEGGYYDRSQNIKTLVCTICNAELDKQVTLGSYA